MHDKGGNKLNNCSEGLWLVLGVTEARTRARDREQRGKGKGGWGAPALHSAHCLPIPMAHYWRLRLCRGELPPQSLPPHSLLGRLVRGTPLRPDSRMGAAAEAAPPAVAAMRGLREGARWGDGDGGEAARRRLQYHHANAPRAAKRRAARAAPTVARAVVLGRGKRVRAWWRWLWGQRKIR